MGERAQQDVKNAELISLPVVLALLLVVFGGLRSALLPLVVAVSGIAGAFLALFLFSEVTDISVYAIQVTTMLGLGLAVDYALLMLVRFREERRTTEDVLEAVHRTVAAAGRTVLFSGLTVAVSLTGLLVFPSVFLRSMGLAVAAVVVIDMLAALTLLRRCSCGSAGASRRRGRRERRGGGPVLRPCRPLRGPAQGGRPRRGGAGAAGAGPARVGDEHRRRGRAAAPRGQRGTAAPGHRRRALPAGHRRLPVVVVARPGTDEATADRIRALGPGATTRELPGGGAVIEIRPPGEADGAEATALVERVREVRGDAPVEVTGTAARLVDFRDMLAERAPWAALTVLAGIVVLLFAFTGSVLLPLRTVVTTLLSLAAALGVVVWVFQDGHLAGLLGAQGLGALSLTAPPLIVAIAFGLAMDYELFILARMREARLRSGDDREAVVTGLSRSGRVVTCAALLLAVVFAAFMTGGFSPSCRSVWGSRWPC